MRILPILFNTDMVQAILDGRKTATRRICKADSGFSVPDMAFYDASKRTYAVHNYADTKHVQKLSIAERTCPICPGDILYVRETWRKDASRYMYRADYADNEKFYRNGKEIEIKWCPSIHMPKEAARIWLKVTDVKARRLRNMTLDDFLAEGVTVRPEAFNDPENAFLQARDGFAAIWNATIKKGDSREYGWNADPWVWVIKFERCEKPEGE